MVCFSLSDTIRDWIKLNLRFGQNGALPRAGALEAVLPGSQDNGSHRVVVMCVANGGDRSGQSLFLRRHGYGVKDDHFVPGHVDGTRAWSERTATEVQDNGTATVDHQVEPAVVARQREPFEWVAAADAHAEQTQSVFGDHFTTYHGCSTVLGTCEKIYVKKLAFFQIIALNMQNWK